LAHQFWKKNSIFSVRIKNNDSRRKINFETYTKIGKTRLTDKFGKPILDKQFKENQKGFVLEKNLEPNELIEFNFISYPEIEFPKFKIYSNDLEISKKNLGAGEKDLYPFQCAVEKECQKLFLAKNYIPESPKKNEFRIQIWFQTSRKDLSNQKNE
jgi:hypothetical protein